MAGFDPVKKAAKWANRMANASQDYIDGVNGVDTSPATAAIAHKQAMLTRFIAAVNSGNWEAALAAVGLASWKDSCIKIGAPRLADGATKGKPKVQRYLAAAKPTYDQIKTEVRAMPNGTDAERQARYQRNQELMKTLKGAGKR